MKLRSVSVKNFKGLNEIKIERLSSINAFVGKNNSGKSSILHAIDIACLAITTGTWSAFQPKLEIKDMISDAGSFEIKFEYGNGSETVVKSTSGLSPEIKDRQEGAPKSILIQPDIGFGMLTRNHRTPQWVIGQIESKEFHTVNALDILFAIKYFSERSERGLTPESYKSIVAEISTYFPDIKNLGSDRTSEDFSTLTYEEYGKTLDILYSGTGLKHFLDIIIKVTLSGAKIVLLDEPELGLHPDLQRQFFDYLRVLSDAKDLQIFIGSHSQVILNYADTIQFYRVLNNAGKRDVVFVDKQAIHTVLSDLGIRPSDLFNQDICLLVEGASEVIFFEHIIRTLYKTEFDRIAIGIIQYGGGAAEAINSGSIDISNIVPAQKYLLWLHDRDAQPTTQPSTSATKFKNKIETFGYPCEILNKREIEYYYPQIIHVAAQQGDEAKETATLSIYQGSQNVKYRDAAASAEVCVPKGVYLKKLLKLHLTNKNQLDQELRDLIENNLISWAKSILGE